MKFGVRQIANVVFRATQDQKIGSYTFKKGQPVFYLDTAKTSSVEGAATTVYAQGGRGNTRLIAWEGEKTLTFTVEDALLSPVSFAILSGAGVVKGNEKEYVHFHQTTMATADANGIIDLSNALEPEERVDDTAPFFVMKVDSSGDITGELVLGNFTIEKDSEGNINGKKITYGGDALRTKFITTYNAGTSAYKFPYDINKDHTATTDEIQGWLSNNTRNLDTAYVDGDYSISKIYFSEPVPEKYCTESDKGSYVVSSDIWTVTNSNTNDTVVLSMPEAMRKPSLTGAELNTILSANTYTDATTYTISDYIVNGTSLWISDAGATQGLPLRFYTKPAYKIAGANGASATISVKAAGSSTEISVDLTKNLRNYIVGKYFGKKQISNESTANAAARALQKKSFDLALEFTLADQAYKDLIATSTFLVDYYVVKPSASVTELQIDAENFAGYYYVEADTLFRRQTDGKDLPANLTFPNVKIQSNFTFSMASTGDPSTFTFTMDAFPGYTYFDKTKKVLCAIQIVDDKTDRSASRKSIFAHKSTPTTIEESQNDSSPDIFNESTSQWENSIEG